MKSLICWSREMWRNLVHWYAAYPISGHQFRNDQEDIEALVTTTICETCGKYEVLFKRK